MTKPTARKKLTLAGAAREFVKHPSPWMIGAVLIAAIIARVVVGDWQLTDAVVPLVMLALFPFFEWMIHVFILHWRPKRVGPLTIDPLLSREHRAHHVDPRSIPLIFIPWKSLATWVLPLTVAVAVLAFPRLGMGLTYLVCIGVAGLVYEWTHYLIHTDYKPKTPVYRTIWRNHRNHHYKNEHFWFTVTSSGTADRVLRTYPDPAAVESSPTVKNLHAEKQSA
ncbi:sterol desaturase family protein [Mycobacterium sp. 2YAF39]|uniref:sterol desaturase family protein n=1 Tax=Mycobacterium sp. 2YAF39 TaxID=3233033 RepID=UPI003F955DB4